MKPTPELLEELKSEPCISLDKRNGEWTGRFYVQVQNKYHRFRERFETLDEARVARDRFRADLFCLNGSENGTVSKKVLDRPERLSHALLKAAPLVWERASVDHRKNSEGNVKQIIDEFEDPLLNNCGQDFADSVHTFLITKGYSLATRNRKYSSLSSILKFAHKRKWMTIDLPELHWVKNEENVRIRWLTQKEEDFLYKYFMDKGWWLTALITLWAIDTGMRRSEILGLSSDNVKEGQRIHLWKTKSKEERFVFLNERAKRILDHLLSLGYKTALFPLPQDTLRGHWQSARKEMGLLNDPGFTFHVLRHTAATRLVDANVNLRVIQKFMGHKNIQTTLRYAKVNDILLQDAADELGKLSGVIIQDVDFEVLGVSK